MKIRYSLAASAVALSVCSFSSVAFAQSTGSQDFEEEIIVTGTRANSGVGGVVAPDTTKAKAVLTQELLTVRLPVRPSTILSTNSPALASRITIPSALLVVNCRSWIRQYPHQPDV